jgi:hypothetical protein
MGGKKINGGKIMERRAVGGSLVEKYQEIATAKQQVPHT